MQRTYDAVEVFQSEYCWWLRGSSEREKSARACGSDLFACCCALSHNTLWTLSSIDKTMNNCAAGLARLHRPKAAMSSGLPSASSRTAEAGEPGSPTQGKESFQQNAGRLSVPAEQPLVGDDAAARQIYGATAKKSNKKWKLKGILGQKNTSSKASIPSVEQALRSQLLVAEANAESAQFQCSKLLLELHEKDRLLRDREDLICRLKQQLNIQQNNNLRYGFLSGGETKAMQFVDQASSLLWRLMSLFYFLSVMGVGLVYYNVQIVHFLLKVFLFGPLRFFLSVLRSLFLGLSSSSYLFCAT